MGVKFGSSCSNPVIKQKPWIRSQLLACVDGSTAAHGVLPSSAMQAEAPQNGLSMALYSYVVGTRFGISRTSQKKPEPLVLQAWKVEV